MQRLGLKVKTIHLRSKVKMGRPSLKVKMDHLSTKVETRQPIPKVMNNCLKPNKEMGLLRLKVVAFKRSKWPNLD